MQKNKFLIKTKPKQSLRNASNNTLSQAGKTAAALTKRLPSSQANRPTTI